MRIYVLDDEPFALRGSVKIIQEAIPDAQIKGFICADDLFEYVTDIKEYPDVIFSDIEMPGISGLDFAVRFKEICPNTKIIFVTAYSQYALDAFRLHVHGYILKPLTVDRVLEELEYTLKTDLTDKLALVQNMEAQDKEKPELLHNTVVSNQAVQKQELQQSPEHLRMQCFGYFEVFWKGEPLMFGRRKTKELLAYLIDRKGAVCSAEEIAIALWEDESNMKNIKARIRILISDLKQTLASIGQEDLIIRRSGQIAIRKESIDCDYYRMLDGDMDAANAFHGEYMVQYSWAEMTAGRLVFEN